MLGRLSWMWFVDPSLVAALWLIPSFFLHTGLHEGSHALAAELTGGHVTHLSVVPGLCAGDFDFGCTLRHGGNDALVSVAPVVAEAIWITGAVLVGGHVQDASIRAVLRAEIVAAITDIGVWLLGAYLSAQSDASQFGRAIGWSAPTNQLVTSTALAVLPLAAWSMRF